MLDKTTNRHVEPATRAWDARLGALERGLATLAESNETRVEALRDAIGDFAAAELEKRDEEIVLLKKQLDDLQQKLEQQVPIYERVHEISARLEEQARRESDKNGITHGEFLQTMGTLITQERRFAGTEFKAGIDEAQRAVEAKLVAVEERLKAVPGKLPVAKTWLPQSVTYQGEFVCHEGALYQACHDTAQVPGGSDWVCVARAGRDGCDGRTPTICGTYNAYKEYAQLDIVTVDGASYIARQDDPGLWTGDGWQLIAAHGGRGEKGLPGARGETGDKGERGEPGVSIVAWLIDRERYRASPRMSDGTVGPMLELRELFEQFQFETS